MKINVLAFGQIADITGKNSWSMNGVKSTEEFSQLMQKEFPDMKNIDYLMAVNKKIVGEETELQNGDTVALLPPFSGG